MAACGSSPTATPTQTPLPGGTPTATRTAGTGSPGWTADLPTGGNEGQLAPDTPVMLADGTTQTLSEVAAGKPVLLHFFATW